MERYVIHITKRCNMCCLHCYEQDKTSEYTWEEIKSFIDNIVEKNKEFEIEFLGGEPLLRLDLIVKSIEYFNSMKDVKVHKFYITTNGTIINDDVIALLKENDNIAIGISLDGSKFMNSLRLMKDTKKNSYDLVMSNIKILQEYDIDFMVHMTLHPYNIGFIQYGVQDFVNHGIKKIDFGIVESTIDIDKEFCDYAMKEFSEISKNIAKKTFGEDVEILPLKYAPYENNMRKYIRDENGKVIGETYGRAEDDVTSKDIYNVGSIDTNESLVTNLKRSLYKQHQDILSIYGSGSNV